MQRHITNPVVRFHVPMLANGASQRHRLRLRIGTERLIADGVGRFTGCVLRRKRDGGSRHHHQGVYATVTPARRQAHRTHVKALPLTSRESTMAFCARIMAAQGTAAAATPWPCLRKSGWFPLTWMPYWPPA